MKATRYPSYKAGLSKNISLLPEHWAELPLKRLFRLEKREPLESDEIVTAFRDGTVTLRKNRREDGFTNALKEIGYQRVHRNDLVIHAMDAFAGAIGVSDSDGKSSPVYSACTATKDANPYFYAYYLRDLALRGFIESLAKGIRERSTDFRWSDASMVAVPVPPQSEQLAIACFLDRETTKIDALIAEQQGLIELLQEKRQAVISHAVTKGLNPNAPMKDSGVEWLGEVPEHWEVCGLSHILNAIGDVDHYMPSTVAEGVPYLMTGDLQELTSQIDFGQCKQVSQEEYEKLSRKIKTAKGDLVMARYATIGTVAYVDVEQDLLVSYSCVTIKPNNERARGMFLFFCLKSDSFAQGLKCKINANTQENVGIGDLKKVRVAIPPLSEQQQISEYLQKETSGMTGVIQASQDTVRLLQERRSALISAAVTGQIDVRELATEEEP